MDDGIAAVLMAVAAMPVGCVQGSHSMSLGLLGLLRTRTVWSDCFVAAVLVDA